MADAPDLGSGVSDVQVQVLLPVLHKESLKITESSSVDFKAFLRYLSLLNLEGLAITISFIVVSSTFSGSMLVHTSSP